jgi:hypothetical protein
MNAKHFRGRSICKAPIEFGDKFFEAKLLNHQVHALEREQRLHRRVAYDIDQSIHNGRRGFDSTGERELTDDRKQKGDALHIVRRQQLGSLMQAFGCDLGRSWSGIKSGVPQP